MDLVISIIIKIVVIKYIIDITTITNESFNNFHYTKYSCTHNEQMCIFLFNQKSLSIIFLCNICKQVFIN